MLSGSYIKKHRDINIFRGNPYICRKKEMLSIIVCSRYRKIDPKFERNLQSTIGVPYEIIWIDNHDNRYNIFSAYNHGIEIAKGDILCFAHEDIVFHTSDWGKIIERYFESEDTGVVGVYGMQIAVKGVDVRLWTPEWCGQLIQGFNTLDDASRYMLINMGDCTSLNPVPSEGVAVDGLFMAFHRRIFDSGEIAFDVDTFNGFHGYDWDICFQVLDKGKKVLIAHDIIIEHKSPGAFNDALLDTSKKLAMKWDHMLPVARGLSEEQMNNLDEMLNRHVAGYSELLIENDKKRSEIRRIISEKGCRSLTKTQRRFLSKDEYNKVKMFLRHNTPAFKDATKEILRYWCDREYKFVYKLKLIPKYIKYLIS